MLISFVILYYKQEKFIKNAIKSILYSNIPVFDYEILLIDNNSRDNISLYCKHNNILYFNNFLEKNQSSSRNIGIKNSKGQYIIFLDCDDYLNPIYLNKLYYHIKNTIKKYYDIYYVSSLTQNKKNNNLFIIRNVFDINEPTLSVCQYVIKRNFLIKNNIYFDEKKYYYDSEDTYFGFLISNFSNNISNIRILYYTHIRHINSNSIRKGKEYYKYVIYMLDMINDIKKINKKQYFKNLLLKIYECLIGDLIDM